MDFAILHIFLCHFYHCIYFRVVAMDSYLCKPKFRWWRGEEVIFKHLDTVREVGITDSIWRRTFPYQHLRKADSKKRQELEKMDFESLYAVFCAAGILYSAAAAVFCCRELRGKLGKRGRNALSLLSRRKRVLRIE